VVKAIECKDVGWFRLGMTFAVWSGWELRPLLGPDQALVGCSTPRKSVLLPLYGESLQEIHNVFADKLVNLNRVPCDCARNPVPRRLGLHFLHTSMHGR